jgi:hypothetical protein
MPTNALGLSSVLAERNAGHIVGPDVAPGQRRRLDTQGISGPVPEVTLCCSIRRTWLFYMSVR